MGLDSKNKRLFGSMLAPGIILTGTNIILHGVGCRMDARINWKVSTLIHINRSWDYFADINPQGLPSTWYTGSARIAINEWLSQFNVRMAQIEAPAGMETKIKVTPTYRSSSYDIKILNPEERHCRFLDEVKVTKQTISGIICFKKHLLNSL